MWIEPVKSIPQIPNGLTNLLNFRGIEIISIAFEDFKKFFEELEQKSWCG